MQGLYGDLYGESAGHECQGLEINLNTLNRVIPRPDVRGSVTEIPADFENLGYLASTLSLDFITILEISQKSCKGY